MKETIKTIHSLRSIRRFTKKDIPNSDLQVILKASVCAANSGGRQCYSIIVVDDEAVLKKLFYGANRALVFCVDFNRIADTAARLGHQYDTGGIMEFITGSTDAILVAQNAAIVAKSLGLDSLFTNSIHRLEHSEIYELFNLPKEYCFPLISLCLGYATEEPPYKKGRLDSLGIIHYGRYQELSDEELDKLIDEYDDKDKHLGFAVNWKKEGFKHYLDRYFTRRLQWFHSDIRSKEDGIITVLQETGFLNL
ncbi:MAG: nitroreductase family protein [Candidatus Hodarchaeales archaeon]|jgi:nitroreductase